MADDRWRTEYREKNAVLPKLRLLTRFILHLGYNIYGSNAALRVRAISCKEQRFLVISTIQ